MYGAILGDIVGTTCKSKHDCPKLDKFPLITEDSFYSINSIMTIAVAKGFLECFDPGKIVKVPTSPNSYTETYPDACRVPEKMRLAITDAMQKLGKDNLYIVKDEHIKKWLCENNPQTYNGNQSDAAARVSEVAYDSKTVEEAEEYARISASITHGYEGIKGAQAVAAAVFMALKKTEKDVLKSYIEEKYGYNLNCTMNEIYSRQNYTENCQENVSTAIIAFLESDGFEDAVCKAAFMCKDGGSSDISTITGSIAGAYYGIPGRLLNEAEDALGTSLAEFFWWLQDWGMDGGFPTFDEWCDFEDYMEFASGTLSNYRQREKEDRLTRLFY